MRAARPPGRPRQAKASAVGVRIEQGGSPTATPPNTGSTPGTPGLPACLHLQAELPSEPNGRGVFSFCACPGGQVAAAGLAEHRVVTNGMSANLHRDKENINGALLSQTSPRRISVRTTPWRVSPSSGLWKPPLIRQDKGSTLPPPSG
ncbi:MAG: FAD-dependent protein [Dysosmobacter sp.]